MLNQGDVDGLALYNMDLMLHTKFFSNPWIILKGGLIVISKTCQRRKLKRWKAYIWLSRLHTSCNLYRPSYLLVTLFIMENHEMGVCFLTNKFLRTVKIHLSTKACINVFACLKAILQSLEMFLAKAICMSRNIVPSLKSKIF